MTHVGEAVGYLASFLVFLTFYTKTMIPLRIVGICSNFAFIGYGYLGGLYPVLILHLILLPLNGWRLREMLRLTKQVRGAARTDLKMDWLKPFTTTRRTSAGDVLFRKGEAAGVMYFIVSVWPKRESRSRRDKSSENWRCWRRTNRARKRSNAPRTERCCRSPTIRCDSFTTRILNSDFIFSNSVRGGCLRISHALRANWPHARLPRFRP
jgi:hypothetical protein